MIPPSASIETKPSCAVEITCSRRSRLRPPARSVPQRRGQTAAIAPAREDRDPPCPSNQPNDRSSISTHAISIASATSPDRARDEPTRPRGARRGSRRAAAPGSTRRRPPPGAARTPGQRAAAAIAIAAVAMPDPASRRSGAPRHPPPAPTSDPILECAVGSARLIGEDVALDRGEVGLAADHRRRLAERRVGVLEAVAGEHADDRLAAAPPSATGRPWASRPATEAAEAGSQKTPSRAASSGRRRGSARRRRRRCGRARR